VPWLIEEPDWRERDDEDDEEGTSFDAEELQGLAESLGLRFSDPEDPEYFE
jgi:hypothetical protein